MMPLITHIRICLVGRTSLLCCASISAWSNESCSAGVVLAPFKLRSAMLCQLPSSIRRSSKGFLTISISLLFTPLLLAASCKSLSHCRITVAITSGVSFSFTCLLICCLNACRSFAISGFSARRFLTAREEIECRLACGISSPLSGSLPRLSSRDDRSLDLDLDLDLDRDLDLDHDLDLDLDLDLERREKDLPLDRERCRDRDLLDL